jgi:hypothetical protein
MRSRRLSYSNRLCRLVACAVLGVMACGCSGGKQPKVVPVAGKVLFEGRPVPRAQVVFVPLSDPAPAAARPVGTTDEDGRFRLSTFTQKDGAPEGEYAVLVTLFPLVGQKDDLRLGPNVLPPRYADPRQSPLKAQVTKVQSELAPFQLTRK